MFPPLSFKTCQNTPGHHKSQGSVILTVPRKPIQTRTEKKKKNLIRPIIKLF